MFVYKYVVVHAFVYLLSVIFLHHTYTHTPNYSAQIAFCLFTVVSAIFIFPLLFYCSSICCRFARVTVLHYYICCHSPLLLVSCCCFIVVILLLHIIISTVFTVITYMCAVVITREQIGVQPSHTHICTFICGIFTIIRVFVFLQACVCVCGR